MHALWDMQRKWARDGLTHMAQLAQGLCPGGKMEGRGGVQGKIVAPILLET